MVVNKFIRRPYIKCYRLYRDNSVLIKGLLIGLIAIAAAYYLMFYVIYGVKDIDNFETAGQFGDMFGSVNSLFSALAFLIIAISLFLQKNELSLQRKQLKLQRKDLLVSRTLQHAEMSSQRKEMRNQKEEMRLTRELHAKSNFESKFIFLLQNLERQISSVKGDFSEKNARQGVRILDGTAYFDRLYTELRTIINFAIQGAGTVREIIDDGNTSDAFSRYGLLGNDNYWRQRDIELPKDFNRKTMWAIHDIRKVEYYNSWLTFGGTMKVLQAEHLEWTKKRFGTTEEIDKTFEIYTELLKSSIPFSARMIYLYLNLLDDNGSCKNFIYNKLYKDVETSDFFNMLHKELLFVNN